jgi:hypothetical protein
MRRVLYASTQTLPPQLGRYVVPELAPLGGKEPSGVHGQPVDVVGCAGTDCGENKGTDSFRVTFGVGRSEDRSPGNPEHDPTLDAEMFSKLLDVVDVVIHVDARPVHAFVAGVRAAPSCRSLVEQHGSLSLKHHGLMRSTRKSSLQGSHEPRRSFSL